MNKYTFIILFIMLGLSNTSLASSPSNELQQIFEQHKGKVIYVDFWASWCGPCRQSFPWMNKMQKEYKDLKIISINLDNDKNMATSFLNETPAIFSIIYDPKGTLAKQYRLKGMPSSYIFNKKGQLISTHAGFSESKQKKYETELLQLLAE